ncbi:MAG: hypothetical protein IH612_03070 [Desulfofustis sp.]|nr:hypothetical protein [Desulfofustis sp.]
MSVKCTLHRSRAAHFSCDQCGSSLCEDCVTVKKTSTYSGKSTDYFCPACELPVRLEGLGDAMEPFWNRLGAIFLYPFQRTPFLLTLALALLGAVFSGTFLISLLVWIVMTKYAYAALIHTAQGSLRAPAITWSLVNENVLQVFKQYVVFALLGLLGGFIFGWSVIAGFAFAALIIACLPAIIMILVATNSVFQAINPFLFLPIIKRIGWSYLLMYLFLFFLLMAPYALFSVLPVSLMHPMVAGFLYLFFSQIYVVISYHLMGYVLLQYHEEIGYSVDYEFFLENQGTKQKRREKTPEEELKTAIALLVNAGKYQEAIVRTRPAILEDSPDLEVSEKFLQLLKLAGEQQKAENYAVRHFEILVNNDKKEQATSLFSEIRQTAAGPASAESIVKVASWYQERNEYKNALSAYAYFTKHHKSHSLAPHVYFESAKLLHEHANNSTKARQILQGIIRTFPEHVLVPQVTHYLQIVQ